MAKRIQKSALAAGVVGASVLLLALHYLTAEGETFYRYGLLTSLNIIKDDE